MRSCRDNVTEFEGAGYQLSGDQSGNVSHVAEEVGVVLVGNLAKTFVVQTPAVAGDSGDDDLRLEQFRLFRQFVVVDQAARRIDLVRHRLEEDGRGGNLLGRREETCSAQTRRSDGTAANMHVQFSSTYSCLPWVRWPPSGRSRPIIRPCGSSRPVYTAKFAGLPE